jgi:hypothetical protein
VEAEAAVRMRVRGVTLVAVASMAALALVGLGLRSFGIAESTGVTSPVAEILAFVVGVWLPLFALIYACVRNRVAVVVLAFCVGLSVNLVFLTHATPAAAVTDNSSVFTFENSTTFSPPNPNMRQNYTPTSSSATTCPGAGGFNWQCSWTSDTFTTGQTLSAGTAQVDLYAGNPSAGVIRKSDGGIGTTNSVCNISRPTVVNGDVLIGGCAFRGGTGTTVTGVPTGWTLVGRADNGANVSIVTYWHAVSNASSEPASYSWTLSASQQFNGFMMVYSGLDNANPIDVEANQATASATSHAAPSVTTTVANGVLLTLHATAWCVAWTPPAGMTELLDFTWCPGGAASNVDLEVNDLPLGAVGPTGTKTATNDGAAVGVTQSIALRPNTAALTCVLTVQLSKPIQFRSADSNISATASIVINKPSGVLDGDVMIASIGYGLGASPISVTPPASWTLVRHTQIGVTNMYGNAVYSRVASSEPASYTWTFNKALNLAGGISAYWNVDTTTPIDVETGGQGTPASITTTQPGDLLVGTYMSTVNTAFTPPAGMTERVDRASGASNSVTLEQADGIQAVAGATGSKNSTPGATTYSILALRPKAGSFLGSDTANVTGPTVGLTSVWIATPAVSFVTGERLQVDVTAPNDQANCGASVSYDSTTTPSKLTVAADVPEGVAGLLLLAPALPLGARWWKRRRP